MAFELSGKVKLVQEPQTFGSGFTKREFVVSVEDGKYTQDISLECIQDKVSMLDSVNAGDEVKVSFDIRGREHNGRYFNNLQAWRIQSSQGSSAAPDDDRPPLPDHEPAELEDDIPF
jgi:single-stranded DNA-binding protein